MKHSWPALLLLGCVVIGSACGQNPHVLGDEADHQAGAAPPDQGGNAPTNPTDPGNPTDPKPYPTWGSGCEKGESAPWCQPKPPGCAARRGRWVLDDTRVEAMLDGDATLPILRFAHATGTSFDGVLTSAFSVPANVRQDPDARLMLSVVSDSSPGSEARAELQPGQPFRFRVPKDFRARIAVVDAEFCEVRP